MLKNPIVDRMVVRFTTTCAISAYHNLSYGLVHHSWRGVLDTTLCDKSFSVHCGGLVGLLRVLRFPPPIKLTATVKMKYC